MVLRIPALAIISSRVGIAVLLQTQNAVTYVNTKLTDPCLMAVTHTGGLINVLRIAILIFFITRKMGCFLNSASCFLRAASVTR